MVNLPVLAVLLPVYQLDVEVDEIAHRPMDDKFPVILRERVEQKRREHRGDVMGRSIGMEETRW